VSVCMCVLTCVSTREREREREREEPTFPFLDGEGLDSSAPVSGCSCWQDGPTPKHNEHYL
jgi:hypothetical protein